MTPIEWIYYAFVLIMAVTAYIYASKQQQQSASTQDDFEATTADEGGSIPVVFGTCWMGQNVVWYGKTATQAVKSKSGKK